MRNEQKEVPPGEPITEVAYKEGKLRVGFQKGIGDKAAKGNRIIIKGFEFQSNFVFHGAEPHQAMKFVIRKEIL